MILAILLATLLAPRDCRNVELHAVNVEDCERFERELSFPRCAFGERQLSKRINTLVETQMREFNSAEDDDDEITYLPGPLEPASPRSPECEDFAHDSHFSAE